MVDDAMVVEVVVAVDGVVFGSPVVWLCLLLSGGVWRPSSGVAAW